jgi:hypothetical protein
MMMQSMRVNEGKVKLMEKYMKYELACHEDLLLPWLKNNWTGAAILIDTDALPSACLPED